LRLSEKRIAFLLAEIIPRMLKKDSAKRPFATGSTGSIPGIGPPPATIGLLQSDP
jgi:hypothetical protein